MKKLLTVLLLAVLLFLLSACGYSRSDLQRIVDEKLADPLATLYLYFENEDGYTFDQAKEAFTIVNDIIYKDFY